MLYEVITDIEIDDEEAQKLVKVQDAISYIQSKQ